MFRAEIVDFREIEDILIGQDVKVFILLLQLFIGTEGPVLHAVILQDEDLKMTVQRLFFDRADALDKILRMVLVRDQDGDNRLPCPVPDGMENARLLCTAHFSRKSDSPVIRLYRLHLFPVPVSALKFFVVLLRLLLFFLRLLLLQMIQDKWQVPDFFRFLRVGENLPVKHSLIRGNRSKALIQRRLPGRIGLFPERVINIFSDSKHLPDIICAAEILRTEIRLKHRIRPLICPEIHEIMIGIKGAKLRVLPESAGNCCDRIRRKQHFLLQQENNLPGTGADLELIAVAQVILEPVLRRVNLIGLPGAFQFPVSACLRFQRFHQLFPIHRIRLIHMQNDRAAVAVIRLSGNIDNRPCVLRIRFRPFLARIDPGLVRCYGSFPGQLILGPVQECRHSLAADHFHSPVEKLLRCPQDTSVHA